MDAAVSNPSIKRIALVTGGNKGVGLETCRQLATKGLKVVLTARNEVRGLEAVEAIRRSSGGAEVFFHQLDVTDPSSAARLADFVKGQFGRLDILINNAGISGVDRDPVLVAELKDQVEGMDVNQRVEWMRENSKETYEEAKQCMRTNYYGAKIVTEALLPLLQLSSSGRIVNVSSGFGLLRIDQRKSLPSALLEQSLWCTLMEGAISSSRSTRIAVVTGGNKGIGLEVCRQLAGNGVTVLLTARDETRGAAAVENLREQGLSNVIFHQLDITDASSIARLADFLKARFGRLDILINNAAFGGVEYVRDPAYGSVTSEEELRGMDRDQRLEWLWRNSRETYDAAKKGLQTNYYGTKHVMEALLPLLQASPDGRIVNVSSDFGLLRFFRNEELKQELNDVGNLTEERLDELLDMFLKDFEAGTVDARGWPEAFSAYKVAKAAMNAYSRILATKQPALRVNCVHPGYIKTDMTRHSGLLTSEEGGSRVVKVALLPEGGVTGAFFEDGEAASFV